MDGLALVEELFTMLAIIFKRSLCIFLGCGCVAESLVDLRADKPDLRRIFLRHSIDHIIELLESWLVLLQCQLANQTVEAELVNIKRTQPNIRKIGLTRPLTSIIFSVISLT